ncbi:flagellar hook-associated protein FlgL [Zooshikella ganghwensis]|uniref:Flagellar hook-associated protein 3 n=1 Tax=Zooshikella ganghwensis TaxID=202772 RepID=A0A4P9VL28_9GAMM|nr:flagellar hook-associated protein FlgL [Zooshikella ganghwensis]RDH43249.1 flagellar hook-associated protein 3 [Zooshikella ganghwensis]
MRISNIDIFKAGLDQILKNNERVVNTQQQVASGRRIVSPGDDPVATTKVLAVNQELAILDQYKRNLGGAENNLKLEEAVLTGVVNIMQRLRELTIQAGDGILTEQDKQAIADEVEVRLQELQDSLNRKDAAGVYIFAGFQADQPPFIEKAGGGFEFTGDEGQRFLQIAASTTVAINDSGKGIFVDIPSAQKTFLTSASDSNTANPPARISVGQIVDQTELDAFYPEDIIITFNSETAVVPNGPNYTVKTASGGITLVSNQPFASGDSITIKGMTVDIDGVPNQGDSFFLKTSDKQDVLTTTKRLQDALNNSANDEQGRQLLAQLVSDTLINIDNTIESITDTQAKIGGRLNTIESTRNLQEDVEIVSEELLAELLYVDEAEAISRLSFENYLLQAAQQSYVAITNLSLFNQL